MVAHFTSILFQWIRVKECCHRCLIFGSVENINNLSNIMIAQNTKVTFYSGTFVRKNVILHFKSILFQWIRVKKCCHGCLIFGSVENINNLSNIMIAQNTKVTFDLVIFGRKKCHFTVFKVFCFNDLRVK